MFGFGKKIVKIKLDNGAKPPVKSYDTDAGYDLFAFSKKKNEKYIEYGTGVYMSIPKGYVGLIFPRSSVTKYDVILKNSVGVIDSGYHGEIRFRFIKIAQDLYKPMIVTTGLFGGGQKEMTDITTIERNLVSYNIGDKIGQIVFVKLPNIKFNFVDNLGDSDRGVGGYGSTGK